MADRMFDRMLHGGPIECSTAAVERLIQRLRPDTIAVELSSAETERARDEPGAATAAAAGSEQIVCSVARSNVRW